MRIIAKIATCFVVLVSAVGLIINVASGAALVDESGGLNEEGRSPVNRVRRSTVSDEVSITSELGKGNDNKVSDLLHFIHRKSRDSLLKKPDPAKRSRSSETGEQGKEAESGDEEPDYDKMSDQEILNSFCDGRTLEKLCRKATLAAERHKPDEMAKIAQAVREKPDNVDAKKLIGHKLLEYGIMKVEAKGYDKTLDSAINLVATKNPYAFGALKTIELTRKLSNKF